MKPSPPSGPSESSGSTSAIPQAPSDCCLSSSPSIGGTRVASTSHLQTKRARSLTQSQHLRFGKFSKLLETVLGSSSSSAASISAGMTDEITTPPLSSPTLSADYTLVSVPSIPNTPQSERTPLPSSSSRPTTPDNIATCSSGFFSSPTKKISNLGTINNVISTTGNKRILPRLWTALASPSRETTVRLKRKGKGKSPAYIQDLEYPLDGEEGELVDDEACFVDAPNSMGMYCTGRRDYLLKYS